jgi:hypothetical protein
MAKENNKHDSGNFFTHSQVSKAEDKYLLD